MLRQPPIALVAAAAADEIANDSDERAAQGEVHRQDVKHKGQQQEEDQQPVRRGQADGVGVGDHGCGSASPRVASQAARASCSAALPWKGGITEARTFSWPNCEWM